MRYATASDADFRDPVQWLVQQSVDGSDWVVMHEQKTDAQISGKRMTYQPFFSLDWA